MSATSPSIDLAGLAPRLSGIVAEAGAIALDFFRGGARHWTKGDDSPVTEADIAVDRFLRERLTALLPEAGWLSEETADTPERLSSPLVWIVDPIDGTRAFVERRPEWVVSVALVENGAPIAGVVYNPSSGESFEAERGLGARLGPKRLRANEPGSLRGARIGGPAALIGGLQSYGIRKAPWTHALAYRFARVAAGSFDAALARTNAHDWDIAAADIILQEAGATLTGLDGRVPVYNLPDPTHGPLVASGSGLHGALLQALAPLADAPGPGTPS